MFVGEVIASYRAWSFPLNLRILKYFILNTKYIHTLSYYRSNRAPANNLLGSGSWEGMGMGISSFVSPLLHASQ